MATFEQRQSGRWQAKIRREGRPKLSRTFLTKEEALSWANFVEERMVLNIFNRGDEKFVTPTQQSKIKAINKSKAQSNKIKKIRAVEISELNLELEKQNNEFKKLNGELRKLKDEITKLNKIKTRSLNKVARKQKLVQVALEDVLPPPTELLKKLDSMSIPLERKIFRTVRTLYLDSDVIAWLSSKGDFKTKASAILRAAMLGQLAPVDQQNSPQAAHSE